MLPFMNSSGPDALVRPKRQLVGSGNDSEHERTKQIRLTPDPLNHQQQPWLPSSYHSPHSSSSFGPYIPSNPFHPTNPGPASGHSPGLSQQYEELLIRDDDEEICYGMLPDDIVQLKWPPSDKTQQSSPPAILGDGRSYLPINIDLQEEYGFVKGIDGQALGVLSNKTFSALAVLEATPGIRFEALVDAVEWGDKIKTLCASSTKKNKATIRTKLSLLLFGKTSSAEYVARTLASSDRFLQDPIRGSIQCRYENPQSLCFSGLPLASPDLQLELPFIDAMGIDEADIADQDKGVAAVDPSSLLVDMDSFYNNLPAHDYLSQHPIDTYRIITPLLSHQREAVDFMSRREQGISSSERGLWQKKVSKIGDIYYQHVITGAKSQTAAECLGGIIADEMGLGKTLSTLSAIVESMDKATAFSQHNSGDFIKSTLVVVPSELLLKTWSKEIDKHILFGTIRYMTYHGPERHTSDLRLSDHDIVLTTYGTAMAEFRKQAASVLYRRKWYRLVLDEAHTIRNASSKQFQAVKQISSHLRWCLTGTPIQNSLDDLGSLVRFLGVPILEDSATFRKHIANLKQGGFKSLQLLLGSICLRRNKTIVPNMDFVKDDRQLDFTPTEQEQYHSLETAFRRSITFAARSQGSDIPHRTVMEALLQLRMFCNNGLHGTSTKAATLGLSAATRPDEVLSVLQQSNEAICSLCSDDIVSISGLADSDTGYMTRCLRLLCHECAAKYRHEYRESGCSLCGKAHGIGDFAAADSSEALRLPSNITDYPSKITALVRDVEKHYLTHKCVIFSFWKRTLDVAARAFDERHIKYSRIDGDITPKKRNNILVDFQGRTAARVLMMTFSTGAVGLNGLTVANRVHILEPQWNPAVESQAIGRVLRIDQAMRVTVIRYIMRRSVEEAVQSRQFRKLQLAGGGFTSERDRRESKLSQMQQLEQLLEQNERELGNPVNGFQSGSC